MKIIRKHGRLFIIVFLVVAAIILFLALQNISKTSLLKVVFLDIGQGDAIFIETPNGTQILIDGGPNNAVIRALDEHMSFFDRTIDMIVVTNPDKDHIGGFIDVLKRYDVSLVVEPGTVSKTAIYKELTERIEKEQAETLVARRGMSIKLDADISLNVLFPDRDVSRLSTNDGSLVAQLIYKNVVFMLTGDAPSSVETYLADMDREALDSDVLKVGHHGSNTSSAESFLAMVTPQYSVISAGKNNRYGHPHEDVLERLTKATSTVLGTYKDGTIVFETDGQTLYRK